MSIQAQPRYTATRLTPRKPDSEHATCHRCGITFTTRHRTKQDRQHCHDCKPYIRKD
ncbi:hypothetical protein [Paenarthrobacter sp. NPDC018779]|uniref:hypothetical protein n=1 Tax=Paenarthrobacter sp. NPDC018779 TaxID=3364375 RepID=UPI0037C75301